MPQFDKTPTTEFYALLQDAYTHFNGALFGGHLPECLLTLQREKRTMGYFSKNRWASTGNKKQVHEIALNPSYFANHKLIEVLQTLVHEQCHLWQDEFGKPSRTSYHNKEWASKMQAIGLIPSSTGEPGGKMTGQKMSDYPEPGGHFINASIALMKKGFALPWVDRLPAIGGASQIRETHLLPGADSDELLIELLEMEIATMLPELIESEGAYEVAKRKQKTKYQCPDCQANVWGKPDIYLICGDCEVQFASI